MLRWGLFFQALAFAGIAAAPNVGEWLLYVACVILALAREWSHATERVARSCRSAQKEGAQGATLGVNAIDLC